MPMPEAPVHKNYLPFSREDQIRVGGKRRVVKTESVAQFLYKAPDQQLGLRILSSHPAHQFAAL